MTGVAWVSVVGLSLEDSISGLVVDAVSGHETDGTVEVADCVFKNIWNTTSIGQATKDATNPCANGWTASIMVGSIGSAVVTNNIFDTFDVAFQPNGAIGKPFSIGGVG